MPKGKAQNKGRAGNQLSKESFENLSQDLQISVLLRLLGHSLTEPKSLDIFKFLCPKPEEYFTETVLSSTQFGSNTVKQNICDTFKIHFYSVTGSNENNLINSLRYLFSDHKLNIKDLILDNDISFDRVIIYLTATKGKKKLLEYLLEHKTNGEFTFKDLLTQKDVVYPNSDIKYSLYDISSDLFSTKLKQYFEKSKIQQENININEKRTILEYYQFNIGKFLNKNKEIISIDKKASELMYLLFSGNIQNIDKFLNELDNIDVATVKSNKISHVIDVFNNGFFFNCDISEQVRYLKVCAKSYQEYGDSKARLKIYNDIKTLIDCKIIDAKDCNFRKQVADFLYSQTSEGFQDIFRALLDKVAKIHEGEAILIKILVNNVNSPIIKVMAYNLLNNKLFDSKKYDPVAIGSYTEKAISLIESNPKIFNIKQGSEDIINDIRSAYWFRAVYYNKSNKNVEAIKYYLKFLELINKENIWNYFEDIKIIISIALNNPELSTEIDEIFTILSKKQGNENSEQAKLFKEIVTSHITEDNAKGYLAQISKFQSANEVKSIALEVCESLANQLLNSAKDQSGLSVKILFKESYLHLPYEAGKKHFSQTKDSGDLVQAVMFFLKYNEPKRAEEFLTKVRKQSEDSILQGLDYLFGELHLNIALSFMQRGITDNKPVIKKHLDQAKELKPSLDIDTYYTTIEIDNKPINDDLKKKLLQNKEIQKLVDEEIKDQNSYNDSNQPVNLPISSSANVEPATTQNDLYQRAIHRYYLQKKRESDNSLNIYSSWKINDEVYSTKDSKIVDLGDNKYCVIDKSKYSKQYDIYQKAMEKGYVSRPYGQNGVKLAGNIYEIKIKSDNRLHNDLKTYVNPEGKTLIIFVEEAGHTRINKICKNALDTIKVNSADVVLEEAIQGTVDQDNNILEQLPEYPLQYNDVDLGGVLHNVESD